MTDYNTWGLILVLAFLLAWYGVVWVFFYRVLPPNRRETKPKIRHCHNCQWHAVHYIGKDSNHYKDCRVKYINILFPRGQALICRHYQQSTEEYK